MIKKTTAQLFRVDDSEGTKKPESDWIIGFICARLSGFHFPVLTRIPSHRRSLTCEGASSVSRKKAQKKVKM